MRNITVAVPDEVYQSARVYAARNKTSVSAMVADFLFTIRNLARADQPVSPGAVIDHHREQLVQSHGRVNFEAIGVRPQTMCHHPRSDEGPVNLTDLSTEPHSQLHRTGIRIT